MAGQCATVPTLTRTDETIVGTRTVTTEVVSTTTAPPTFITTTISTDICTTNTTSPISSECTPTFSISVETVEGTTSLVTLTSTIENPITSSITTTLFTTSCTTPDNNNNNTPDPPPTPTPEPPTSTTTSSITTETTSSTTLPNGSISVSTFTLITNAPPSPTTQTDQNNSNDGGPNIGAIAGGVVGGFVGLLALALLSWYFYKRSTSGFDRVFNNPDDFDTPHNHNHQDKLGPLDDEPIQAKGYQYGLLGNEMGNAAQGVNASGATMNGSGMAPFNGGQELGFQGPSGGNEMGYQPSGNDTGYQPDGTHSRNHSLAPLLGGVAGAAAGAAAYAVATTPNSNNGHSRPGSTSRPSTGGSGQALITPQPSPQPYGPQQGYVAQNTYPPQSQGYSRSSYYGSSDHSTTAYNPNPSMMSNPSVGSSSWAAGSSSAYVPPQLPQGMMAPLVPGVAPPATNRPHSFDQDGRSGSPVSIQEQRVLQVINPDSSQLGSSPPQGSSLGSPASPAGGPSGQRTNSVDGKGRPIDTRGQFVPLVHLDGGIYEEPLPPTATGNATAGRSSESQPPAYTG